ncbi:hypothetical protein QR680_011453 [Steinernema hermaphroditum]|uniref:Uncharacterized protein n=1 Tax=Steinernema hermaphroditum TaxID=289476 RepID=A0AA39LY43_9BILA|nr:hypothetical protein QR680_011453 [Steinernema hermaphroditum]
MACPYGGGAPVRFTGGDVDDGTDDAQAGTNKVSLGVGSTYSEYLMLDKLLDCQHLKSAEKGALVPDEHLFIVIHQTYELWFKQIIFDLDIVRNLLNNNVVDETKTLRIVSGLERTVKIMKLLVDQILVLETINFLIPASGFQSLQFRLLENKLGVNPATRVKYNAQHYREVFNAPDHVDALHDSETSPSLLALIIKWLERVPGIEGIDGEPGFWEQYVVAVNRYLDDMKRDATKEGLTTAVQEQLLAEYMKTQKSFATILDEKEHDKQVNMCERRLTHQAMKGALMIYFYRDMPRFSQPYQILTFLMDIDSLLTKWRYNHVMLVQRMLGSKQGTGGSSGYLYLRTTVSDRYKVFLDLFNLSTWLIPRDYIPTLSPRMVKTLSEHKQMNGKDI